MQRFAKSLLAKSYYINCLLTYLLTHSLIYLLTFFVKYLLIYLFICILFNLGTYSLLLNYLLIYLLVFRYRFHLTSASAFRLELFSKYLPHSISSTASFFIFLSEKRRRAFTRTLEQPMSATW